MKEQRKSQHGAHAGSEQGAGTLSDRAASIAQNIYVACDRRLYTFTPAGLAAVRAALAKKREGTS